MANARIERTTTAAEIAVYLSISLCLLVTLSFRQTRLTSSRCNHNLQTQFVCRSSHKMGSRSTFTNSKGVKKSGEHRTICQTSSLMLTPNLDVKYGVRRGMHERGLPAPRLHRSPLPLPAAGAIYPHEDCVGNGRFRYAEYRSFSALY